MPYISYIQYIWYINNGIKERKVCQFQTIVHMTSINRSGGAYHLWAFFGLQQRQGWRRSWGPAWRMPRILTCQFIMTLFLDQPSSDPLNMIGDNKDDMYNAVPTNWSLGKQAPNSACNSCCQGCNTDFHPTNSWIRLDRHRLTFLQNASGVVWWGSFAASRGLKHRCVRGWVSYPCNIIAREKSNTLLLKCGVFWTLDSLSRMAPFSSCCARKWQWLQKEIHLPILQISKWRV